MSTPQSLYKKIKAFFPCYSKFSLIIFLTIFTTNSFSHDISKVVNKVLPSVVLLTLENTQIENNKDKNKLNKLEQQLFPNHSLTKRFASGVIIDNEGHILTTSHVIEPSTSLGIRYDKITISLKDGKDYSAQIVSLDNESNVALLKIDAANISAATIGNSKNINLAEHVFAVSGSHRHSSSTVSDGIVSLLPLVNAENRDFIQTSAYLYPLMNGGPLFNLQGELIGINVAVISKSTKQSISFAIPINDAIKLSKQFSKRK